MLNFDLGCDCRGFLCFFLFIASAEWQRKATQSSLSHFKTSNLYLTLWDACDSTTLRHRWVVWIDAKPGDQLQQCCATF